MKIKEIKMTEEKITICLQNGIFIEIDDDYIVVNDNLIPIKELLPENKLSSCVFAAI